MSVKDLPHITVEQVLALRDRAIELENAIINIAECYSQNTGYEPSLSVFQRSLSEAMEIVNK